MAKVENLTIGEAWRWFVGQLTGIYDQQEATSIGREVFLRFLNIAPDQRVIRAGERLNRELQRTLEKALNKLKLGMPVQYVTGVSTFLDLEFDVGPQVLIPRQETQELVLWVASTIGKWDDSAVQILDIGTGSGCIAIALAKLFEHAKIFACDISIEALEVAKINAQNYHLGIHFFLCDILEASQCLVHSKGNSSDDECDREHPGITHLFDEANQPVALDCTTSLFDCIISNPPYVMQSEKTSMMSNVLGFEPEMALFVDDEEPLKFYRAIGIIARQYLKPGGMLFFEINEAFGKEVSCLIEKMGFLDVTLRQDINGKDRFLSGVNGLHP